MNKKRIFKTLTAVRQVCIKSITKNINDEEEQLLKNWLSDSDKNRKEYEKISTLWEITLPKEIPQMPQIDEEWEALYNRIILYNNESSKEKSSKKYFKIRLIPQPETHYPLVGIPKFKPALSAAMLILLILIGIIFLNRNTNHQIKTLTTSSKERKHLTLSDGSTVYLNSNSSIKYLENFKENIREVNLIGEAYFSVVKNYRPFVVVTNNAKITVLGTKFDVWARNEKTRVIVKEGKVTLSSKKSESKKINLLSGQTSFVSKDMEPAPPTNVDTDNMLAWINGKLIFNHTPLIEVIEELERCFNTKLILENSIDKNKTLTGTIDLFENYDIDSVLSMICLTFQLEYEKKGNEYIIKQRNISAYKDKFQ